MTYQVLSRKWRPQTFNEVVGQEHIIAFLTNGLSLGRIHHAYLFSGIRGIGKTSISRILAKGLNCKNNITSTPCNVCSNCCEIKQGRFVDLIEIDAASKAKVEDIRVLLDNVQYAPVTGRFKIYLIDEVHMLSNHSFNALLKTLEEPPSHVKFILATTNPRKLPNTILSRCLKFHLRTLDSEQIVQHLKFILSKEQISYESQALQSIACSAEGSLRDALSLTDQAIAGGNGIITTSTVNTMLGILDRDEILSLIEAIVSADGEKTMMLIDKIAYHGVEWERLLIDMQTLLHKIAMIQLHHANITIEIEEIKNRICELANSISPTDVQLYYQILLIGRKELPLAPNERMGVEMTLLRALAFHPKSFPIDLQSYENNLTNVDSNFKMMTKQPKSSLQNPPSLLELNTSLNIMKKLFTTRKYINDLSNLDKFKSSKLLLTNKRSLSKDNIPKYRKPIIKKENFYLSSLFLEKNKSIKTEISSERKFSSLQQKYMKKLKEIRRIFQYEEKLNFTEKLINEVVAQDVWAAEVNKLKLPKLIEQIALNSWKEQEGDEVCLHLRPLYRHLNSIDAQKKLSEAISILNKSPVKLTIVEDNNHKILTPVELYQVMYNNKFTKVRKSIIEDKNILMFKQFFNAELDEESIIPI